MRMNQIVNDKRPINLDLASMKYPPMAIASILHRISGLILFLLMPIMLYFFSVSLRSSDSFEQLETTIRTCVFSKLVLWGFCSALLYHVIAGIRHIAMDLGFGETLYAAKRSAVVVIMIAVIATILLGMWIW